jgi:hypothetical protein
MDLAILGSYKRERALVLLSKLINSKEALKII